ncbi:hypothetical protein [Cellulomonas sp. URHD0024]|uniref:hypothetical protein n=1 Tax=Cellulomonas sp. URHD0024 TaxID=1302620 RepID=UPI0003FB3BAB|nr:hypothetical protein [Cellulomonas sp. URHD0024]
MSGGPPSGVLLPYASAEGRIVTDDETGMVEHTRVVFDRGGFPGCSDEDRAGDVIASLRADLLPL